MQCHNTDVILSARFSNKLEPPLRLLWQQFTRRYLRSESETRAAAATTQGCTFFKYIYKYIFYACNSTNRKCARHSNSAQSQLWRNKQLLFPTEFLLHNNRARIIHAVHLENLMKSLFFFLSFSWSNQSAAFVFRL